MKKISIILLFFLISGEQFVKGQFVVLTAPIFQGVYQRGVNNYAYIPIVGQVAGPSGLSYQIECITQLLDQNGNAIANTTSTDLITNNAPKGIFNGSLYRLKGWYSIEIKITTLTSSGSSSFSTYTKCGVGDVFIIAGQSNGQGVPTNLPSPTIPEWIVGNNDNWQCRKEFEQRPIMSKIASTDRIGPAGTNGWCYGLLGNNISSNNQNMPVAFFNTCSSGSSVKMWRDGALNNIAYRSFNVNNEQDPRQWCYNEVPDHIVPDNPITSPDEYYRGQPYLTLKNTLNWYVPLFGVRAILWHQGEADANQNDPNNPQFTNNSASYQEYLQAVINQSRSDLGNSSLSWMIAKVTLSNENITGGTNDSDASPLNSYAIGVRTGQEAVTNGSSVQLGPLTDRYLNTSTLDRRNFTDKTHFDELYLNGVTTLANLWSTKIDPTAFPQTDFARIASSPVPTISILKIGTNFTYTVATGASAYCWTSGATLAPPVFVNSTYCLGTSNTFTNSSGSIRCYIKNGNNWQSTAQLSPLISCSSCREGAEEVDETYGGINMKLYPNPSDKDFRIEFDVLEDDTHVKLEFFDMMGNSVKVIADGSHAKGHFVYPITETLPTGASICQLKVGEIFISKKMVKLN